MRSFEDELWSADKNVAEFNLYPDPRYIISFMDMKMTRDFISSKRIRCKLKYKKLVTGPSKPTI